MSIELSAAALRKMLAIIERQHQAYADPLDGGYGGYQGACHDCDWRGKVFPRTRMPQPHIKREAREEATAHEEAAGLVLEAKERSVVLSPWLPVESDPS